MQDETTAAAATGRVAPEPQQTVAHRAEFHGTTGEYFGIWFVNLLLGIATLGIYSAWAKVRSERYFYGNTRLAGSSFEYTASPIAILKGRLIAYAFVIALGLSAKFVLPLYIVLILALVFMLPALLTWTLRFRARNSAWRGIAFHFDRRVGEAYPPYLFWGWLVSLTMTLVYPLMKQRQHAFLVEGHRYGKDRFGYAGDTGEYYKPYGWGALAGVVLFIAYIAGIVVAVAGAKKGQPGQMHVAMYVVVALFYLGFLGIGAFLRTRYTNLMWNSSWLGPHRFRSTLRARDVLWLYASNIVAVLCTIGLALPWARIRLAKYRAGHFELLASGSIDQFIADQDRQYGARSSELVDALDLGMDIGL
ncbi:MAG: YjgN family protein [Thermomonas sp.]